MIRITTLFLCLLLAAAALGRYKAEVSVRETRQEMSQLDVSIKEEAQRIQVLRAEIAYLENPERLTRIAEAKTSLRPSDHEQILSGQQFAANFIEGAGDEVAEPAGKKDDVIFNAIAMAQTADAQ